MHIRGLRPLVSSFARSCASKLAHSTRFIRQSKRIAKNSVRTIYIANKKYKENLSEKMRKKIDDPVYRELYTRRMQIIEPVFANITFCKGMNRFTLRSEKRVDIQWKLYCIVHNIGKCVKSLTKKIAA